MDQTVSNVAEDYFSYNAMLNLLSEEGQIQFDKDKIAVRQYFLQHVNKNMVFFHDLQEKLDYLIDNQYYEKELLDKYHYEDIKKLFKSVYAHKFRFASFQGAYKFYKQYALKTNDGQRYLERLEDRVAMCALYLGDGNISEALDYSEEIISGRYQPATPTFLSAGRKQRGEPVSCFPAGTKILTSTGSKDIEDIEVGDKVLTHTGKYQPVEKLNKRLANEKLHAIKAVGHPEFYCTPEHPILIWSSNPNDKRTTIIDGDGAAGDLKWIAAKDINSETDYIVSIGSRVFNGSVDNFKTYKVLINAVSKENYNDYVYNLHVKDDHTYQVNGVIVHNCFLINVQDDMESIARSIGSALQLSKRGGGVALCLTDVREAGAPIKGIDGAAAGLVPVMKLYEDSFSYADQLGQRDGAGAVYVHACHPDIMAVLDTKRENADEKVRIKTLSIGVVIPDILYEMAEKNEALYLFSPYDVKRLYGVPLSMINVTKKYHELVANKGIRKKKVNARKLMEAIGKINGESGYPYIMNEDVVNAANPIDGYVRMSNLCVAPETNILTDKGDVPIVTKVDQEVNVWNGEEWSKVTVRKTGENQKLLTVKTSDGRDLDCTEYHKWYKQEGYGRQATITEVRTIDLEPGDKLIKWTPPIIEGKEEFTYPYLHGFISADGTMLKDDKARIYLYNKKLPLVQSFGLELKWRQGSNNRLEAETIVKYPKYTVPTAEYTIKSRLDWLAGWLDGDGSVYRNGDNEALVGSSSNEVFIKEIQSLLLTLGVNAKISTVKEAGFYKLPLNDGSGNYSDYYCKKNYRILINSDDTQNLLNLGLILKRLVVKKRDIQRKAAQFVVVVDVQDNGRYSDTYCFTEPKRHMGVFNGILTGNCSEILQVQTDSEMNEDGSYKVVGKDVSCNLGSLNVFKAFHSPNFKKTIEVACRALTKVSDLSNIACVPSIDNGNKMSHAIGLGAMNLHGFFGHHRIMYGSPASIDFTDLFFMTVNYYSILSSCKIAQEKKETFQGFEKSDYANGAYFDKYINRDMEPKTEQVKKLFAEFGFEVPTKEMWVALCNMVMEHGLYNQYRMAIPPTGSISYVNNSTASIHPISAKIEIRKEGKTGRSYYPAPHMTNDNHEFFVDAYELGYKAVIDVYAAATPHVDQGLSLTIFLPDNVSTRDINRMQVYARSKGIKTIYYVRLRKSILSGTEVEGCVSCAV